MGLEPTTSVKSLYLCVFMHLINEIIVLKHRMNLISVIDPLFFAFLFVILFQFHYHIALLQYDLPIIGNPNIVTHYLIIFKFWHHRL